MIDSVGFRYARQQWHPWIFLPMPDHCHGLFSFPSSTHTWKKTVRDWKHWLATKHGVQWQIDFFDHRLREDESFAEKFEYILQNPVRAGFVAHWRDWPYRWEPPDVEAFTGLAR